MQNFNAFEKFLTIVLIVIFTLTIFFSVLKISVVDTFSKESFNLVSAIRVSFIEKPIKTVINKISDITTLENIRKENELLRENVDSILRYQLEIEQLKNENKELNEMLDFKDKNKHLSLTAANVVYRNIDAWDNVFKIDVGSNDNIKVNDAVMLANGLLGKVENVYKNEANVRLLTSNDTIFKVAIKIKIDNNEYVEGILEHYDANLNAFKISLLEVSEKLNEEQFVFTSGSGEIFPKDLLVGYISIIESSKNEVGQSIYVKPTANFKSFDKVFVVKDSD